MKIALQILNSGTTIKKLNTKEVIFQFTQIHGDKYMYPSVKYNGNGEKIKIFCPKDEHGEFEQTPANHKTGHGCPKCATETRKISNIMSFHLFVEKANKIHNKYEYSSLDYNGVKKRYMYNLSNSW